MKKLILILAFMLSSVAFAGGWDWFNPSSGGTAQFRTGVSFDHEAESAAHDENCRIPLCWRSFQHVGKD